MPAAADDSARTVISGGWSGQGLLTGLRATGRPGPLDAGGEVDPGGDTADPNGRTLQLTPAPNGDFTNVTAAALAAGPPLPVRTVGDDPTADYQLGERIGEGGSGVVREAIQVSLGRTVAVKRLKPGRPDARPRFLAEARVVGGLDHPNILPVYELAADEGGEPFLVMKRVVGTPWSESIRTMTRAENLRILAAVADAVAFAHSRGVVHRDIKPENVLLGAFGEVLLNDWGLALTEEDRADARDAQRRIARQQAARCRADRDDGEAPTGRLCGGIDATGIAGTPAYMAPEQARGDAEDLGPGTDVYLLGAVLFEIATGRRPHAGETLTACLKSAAANRLDLPEPPRQEPVVNRYRPERFDVALSDDPCGDDDEAEWDAELVQIARRVMADDPADRPPGVAAFKELLAEYESHTESVRLTRRGRQLAAEADRSGDYASFGLATRTLMEALAAWEGNDCARQTLRAVRIVFAERACDNGDLELGEGLIEAGGLHDEPVAERCREARQRLANAEAERSALEQGVLKWSRAFLASPDCVFLVDLTDGRVTEVNDQFTALLGYAPADVVGKTVDEAAFWPPSRCREKFVHGLQERGEFENAEVDFHMKGGGRLTMLVSARATEVDGRRVVVANARDMTVRKRQEAGLKKSEDRLRRTQRIAGLGTWELDVASGAVYWSEETFRIAGLEPADEPPGFDEYLDTVHPDDRPALLMALDAAGKGGDGFEVQVRHRLPTGGWNRVLTRGEPIKDADGNVLELFGSVLDVSGSCDAE
ncbi:protein kinase domain-containing protein [Alienimonas californiensis]|uniref:Serine/threonine-protein kinase PknD n=1 Tax=Alienimonas californiensis TaxID=2527989 RepID=A0A517P5Z1_9PLAN|nr:protein kinase [Alienimonas californiensis]QDT14775.1 Serine/threonine-protein kinase PknD [Alienimonas californiensis]